MARSKPCPVVGCPHLKPCPKHPPRDPNAPWSRDRDRQAHDQLRRLVVKQRGRRCERCGRTDQAIEMHHIRPRNTPADVVLLCAACHRAVDTNAR